MPPGARPGGFHLGNSPHFRAFSVIAGVSFHGRIPLRRDTASSFLKKINSLKFIEKPREFIGIYRIFRKLLFAFCAFRASPGRRLDSREQHPFRHLKNPESTGGLSSIPHRRENPATANAGKCAGRAGR